MDTRTLPELQEENDEIIKAYFQNGLGLAKTFNGIANYFSKIFKIFILNESEIFNF